MRQNDPQIPIQILDMLDRVVQFDISDLHEEELRDGALERGEFETGTGLRVAESVLELGCELVEEGFEEARVVCGAGVEVVDLEEEDSQCLNGRQ